MPYRRLPNTDQARLRALRTAIEANEKHGGIVSEIVISHKSIQDAKVFLNQFEKLMAQYQQALGAQVEANKTYQKAVKNARLYISHFIQVLNMCVQRNEIKREAKRLYKLEPDSFAVPDLTSEATLLKWGQNLIDGEAERTNAGGTPLYNPTIAKLKVHYDIFKDYKTNQKTFQTSTNRYLNEVAQTRDVGDNIILRIWDEVEAKFADLPPYSRLKKCQSYGLVYYYRRGENELTPEDDFIQEKEIETEVDFVQETEVEKEIEHETVIQNNPPTPTFTGSLFDESDFAR